MPPVGQIGVQKIRGQLNPYYGNRGYYADGAYYSGRASYGDRSYARERVSDNGGYPERRNDRYENRRYDYYR